MIDPAEDAALEAVIRDWVLPSVNATAGIDQTWVQAFLATRMADLLCQMAVGERFGQMPVDDRRWLLKRTEKLVTEVKKRYERFVMPDRDLDPDHDYHYDRTNQPPRRIKSSLVKELEARAKQCDCFTPHDNPGLYGVCTKCNGPKYAHTETALKNRKLL